MLEDSYRVHLLFDDVVATSIFFFLIAQSVPWYHVWG